MANWMMAGAKWQEAVYERLRSHLLSADIAHADETSVQVLNEAGRSAKSSSYMWMYCAGRDGPPLFLFDYQTTRAAEHPRRFLREGPTRFNGYLHVDGYSGYDALERVDGLDGSITLAGCWAHARRKFHEALSLLPPEKQKLGGTLAHAGLAYCDALFDIERDLKNVSAEQRMEARRAKSEPVLAEFRAWLDAQSGAVLPKSALGTAIAYCRNQWKKLTAFLMDGRLELDNNRAERAIKPFVIGRKNWLFANTPRGERASAVLYSIVKTAKANGLDPLKYLTYLFERLPNIDLKNPVAVDQLLPWAEAAQNACRVPLIPSAPATA